MTQQLFRREKIPCPWCGHEGDDYKAYDKGPHVACDCAQCGRFIKYISKADKYGTKEQQEAVWRKTGGRCCYCGTPLNPFKKKGYTYEHFDPKSNGGSNETANLMPCCKSCNSSKGPKTLSEYREHMKKITGKKTHVFYFEVLEYGPNHISDILKKLTIG